MRQKAVALTLGFLAAVAAPIAAFADIDYESQSATTTALIKAIGGDLLTQAVVVIGVVMGIAVLIYLVRWGWGKLKHWGMRG